MVKRIIAALALASAAALAARNSGGTYALPNPAVSAGQLITSSWANTSFNDFAAEFTDSLSRSGKGGMLAPLRTVDGSAGAPGFSWNSETNTGLRRFASGIMKFSILGNDTVVLDGNTNSTALTATGNGSGTGLVGNGGATGAGGSFLGGATSGNGINVTGGGTSGTAVAATGGGPNGVGNVGQGTGTGAGGQFTGGVTASAVGAQGTGGSGGGRGLVGIGTVNSAGVDGTGAGTGTGGNFTGGATGAAVTATAGGGGSPAKGSIMFTPQAAPSSPSDGNAWVETSSNRFKVRINGATSTMVGSPLLRTDLPAVGQQVSASSGSFSTVSASFVDVTNLSVTLTTTGRPVVLLVIPDGTTNPFSMLSAAATAEVAIDRGGSNIALEQWGSGIHPPLFYLDVVGAGTYTYKLRTHGNGASQMQVSNAKLAAYEL